MDITQPGNRSQSSSIPSTGSAITRRRGGRHLRLAATGSLTQDFRVAIQELADRRQVSINRLWDYAADYGKSTHWMRERYYGGTNVTLSDLEFVHSVCLGILNPNLKRAEIAPDSPAMIVVYRDAVEAMCRSCAGVDVPRAKQSCWDQTCPLRPISPLPLGTQRNDPLTADDVR